MAAAEVAPPVEDPEKKAAMAAASQLFALTGRDSHAEALAQVEIFRASHIELEKERQALAAERAALEAADRRKLCIELIALGAEFPSTVWADDAASALKPRWLEMPIAALREHTAEQRAVRGAKRPPAPPKVASESGGKAIKVGDEVVELSAREVAICEESGAKLEVYAANKLRRKA